MLKEVSVENFKSINKEQLFSMEACPGKEISEHPDHLIRLKGTNLLKVATMYGPNGGGKSNLLNAIYDFKAIIKGMPLQSDSLDSITYLSSILSTSPISKFVIVFEQNEYELKYELSVDISKNFIVGDKGRIVVPNIKKEEMTYLDKTLNKEEIVYSRNSEGIVQSERLKDMDLVKSKTKLSLSHTFAAYIMGTFNNSVKDAIYSPIFNFANEIDRIQVLNRGPQNWTFDEEYVAVATSKKRIIIDALNKLDINACDFYFQKNNVLNNSYDLYISRQTKDGNKFSLPLSKESSGTKKIIALLFDILFDNNNKLYLADDFDAYLHPKLIGAILDLFNSKENTKKQIIFNSHDIINMNNQHFRRDEIWFAFRDENNQTIYLPLSNIYDYEGKQIRKDAKYGKQYLEGRYGGDPFIKGALNWECIG